MKKAAELPVGTVVELLTSHRGAWSFTKFLNHRGEELWANPEKPATERYVVIPNETIDYCQFRIESLNEFTPKKSSNVTVVMMCYSCLAYDEIEVPAVTMHQGNLLCASHAQGQK